jgi:transcriptional regulator with PAS, ATPase and Fis domain
MQRLAKSTGSLDQYMRQETSKPHPTSINSNFYTEDVDSNIRPIILTSEGRSEYEQTEVIEENLSLESMEKDLIGKALKKHRGRRKDAAEELGISERTLYRKIKQYEIEE